MAIAIVQAKVFNPETTSDVLVMDSAITAGNAVIVHIAGSSGRTYGLSVPTDGAFSLIETVVSTSFRTEIYAKYNVTGGSTDVTCTANATDTSREVVVVEVSGLGSSPTVLSDSVETDTDNVNSTSHPCSSSGLNIPGDSFVIGGGKLNADGSTLTKNAGCSAEHQYTGIRYGLTQWGIFGSESLADDLAWTSSGTRQHINAMAVFSVGGGGGGGSAVPLFIQQHIG